MPISILVVIDGPSVPASLQDLSRFAAALKSDGVPLLLKGMQEQS
jgi:hypothetical protein